MATAPTDFSKYLKPPSRGLNGDIATQGPPKHGKTFFAASASKYFPEGCRVKDTKSSFSAKPASKPSALRDILWVAIDAGATDGFAEVGIELPHFVDMRAMMADLGVVRGRDEALKLIKSLCQQHSDIEFIVVDTISQLDKNFVTHYVSPDDPDTQKAFGNVFNSHKHLHSQLGLLKPKKHYLCHSRAKIIQEGSARAEGQKKQKTSVGLPGGDDIMPDITGQGRTLYLGNASILFACIAKMPTTTLEKRSGLIYCVYPYGGKAFEGGNRFHQTLDTEEPADLRAILTKIQAAAK